MSDLKILRTESGQQVVDYEYAKNIIEQQQARISELERREAELAATVEKLRGMAKEAYREKDGWTIQDLQKLGKAALETPPTNLNAVRREVAKEAILAAIEDYKREYCGQGIEALLSSFADIYPAKRYPDKE